MRFFAPSTYVVLTIGCSGFHFQQGYATLHQDCGNCVTKTAFEDCVYGLWDSKGLGTFKEVRRPVEKVDYRV